MGGQKYPWDAPLIIGMIVAGAVSAMAYCIWASLAADPIFPLRLLTHYEKVSNLVSYSDLALAAYSSNVVKSADRRDSR